ncbi:MAG TPA: hypothetical protein VGI10_29170 [Polyangiaceae bacterium]|jgi:hypothetical protein
MGGTRLRKISRRALVQLTSAGAALATASIAGIGLLVEACAGTTDTNPGGAGGNGNPYGSPYGNPYGSPYGNPYGSPYGNPYGSPYGPPYGYYGLVHRGHRFFASLRMGPRRKVDLG